MLYTRPPEEDLFPLRDLALLGLVVLFVVRAMKGADVPSAAAGDLGGQRDARSLGRRLAPHVHPLPAVRNTLPALRSERGWTQVELARHLGVSRQTVNAIENGRYDPSLPLAFAIAGVFAKAIEEIFEPDARSVTTPGARGGR